jgi:hypothetical protein
MVYSRPAYALFHKNVIENNFALWQGCGLNGVCSRE